MSPDIGPIMQSLTASLCDRRALGPLKHLLEGWPMIMATSDEWHALWSALRNLRGVASPELTATERALVEEAYHLVDRSIRAAGQVPGGPSA
jgi:hypothetical protein